MKGGKQNPERLKGQRTKHQCLQLQNLLPRPWLSNSQACMAFVPLFGILYVCGLIPALAPGIPLAPARRGTESFLPALVALLWRLVMSAPSLCWGQLCS